MAIQRRGQEVTRSPGGQELVPLEESILVTFTTRRGTFYMSAEDYESDERRAYVIASETPRGGCQLSKVREGTGWLWTWRYVISYARPISSDVEEDIRRAPSRRWTGR